MVTAPSEFFRLKARSRGFAEHHFGHHDAWPHTASPQHVQRQETCPSNSHHGHRGYLAQQLRLEAGPPIPCLGDEEDPRVLEKSLVVVQSVGAHLLELSHTLPPQDLLDSVTTLSDARRAAWTHRAASCGDEWTGDTGGDLDHVVKNAVIHRVNLVFDIKPIRAAGQEVDQMPPAGLWFLGLGHQLLGNKVKRCGLKKAALRRTRLTHCIESYREIKGIMHFPRFGNAQQMFYLQHGPLHGEGVTELLSTGL